MKVDNVDVFQKQSTDHMLESWEYLVDNLLWIELRYHHIVWHQSQIYLR